MKIVYVGAFRFPDNDAAAARVLNNARALRQCGHEVAFISWGGRYVSEAKRCGEDDIFDGFHFIITGELDMRTGVITKILNRLRRGWRTLQILKNEPRPDVIIAYNPDLIFNIKLKRFSSRYGIKYANDITEWSDKKELRFIERITNFINLKFYTHRIKNKIVISSFLEHYYSSGNILVVPPLCDLSEKKWNVGNQEEDSHNHVSFIYAGNPARKDNLFVIINSIQEAFSKGYAFRLLILGITKEQFIRRYSNLLVNKKLDDRILFLGKVKQEEVPMWYKRADYMVLIREYNRKAMAGFPTKFTEAFASGTPVVANLTSDLNKYLLDGQTGFIVPGSSVAALNVVLDKISVLSREKIENMKKQVSQTSYMFDYRHYITEFSMFISNMS